MMLKVSDGFLDFDGDVEMERQVKLFENVKETWGDFSYTFELALTDRNLKLLGLPFPDNRSKLVYNKITADLLSESGEILYRGFLRVEKVNEVIETSFFSGNNNWLGLLTGNMTDLRLDQYDQAITVTNIQNRANAGSGIIFPLIDTGVLVTRKYNHVKPEDFVGCFYLKTLMSEVFQQAGLKLDGELLSDPLYNTIVVATNTRSKEDQINHSLYVRKDSNQVLGAPGKITFEEQTNPFYVGEDIDFDSDMEFVPSANMIADIEVFIESASGTFGVKLRQERIVSPIFSTIGDCQVAPGVPGTMRLKNVPLYVGYKYYLNSGVGTISNKSTWKITPRFIKKAFGKSCVPLWKQEDFVSNVLSIFNVISDFDPYSKTVTLNLFNKIKNKTPIDLSSYVKITDTDYVDFISSYGKKTLLSYDEGDDEDLREYNISTFYRYGSGSIDVNNEFIEESTDLVESDFTSPISYVHPAFGASLERVNFVELDEEDAQDITSITDSSGTPQFNITNAEDFYSVNDLVRIEIETLPEYNGDWIIDSVTPTYITVKGAVYSDTAAGEVKKLVHNFTTDDSVFLFINSGERDVVDFASTKTEFYVNSTTITEFTLAFFNLIHNSSTFNTDFKQSLSFGPVVDPLFYQRTIIDTYWPIVGLILNDPVKITCDANIPEYIFKRLTPLTPVSVRTEQTTNTYYLQKHSGYKGSQRVSEIELIKLP